MLDEKRSVGHLELDFLLDLVVVLGGTSHLSGCSSLGHVSSTLKRSRVADESWRALDSLLKSVLLDESLDLLLELILLRHFLFFHLSATKSHIGLVLLGSCRLLNLDISVHLCFDTGAARGLESCPNVLVGLVHVFSEVGSRLWLVEVEWLGDCWSL